jgi:hypothetical protein
MKLLEGGNVFKDKDGNPLTQRIDKKDVPSTIRWLEKFTGLDFTKDLDPTTNLPIKWLGSTGKTPTSGDLDLAVDSTQVDKAQFKSKLDTLITQQGQEPKNWVRLSGEAVHLLTPISGDRDRGFVQTDFMFMPDLKWGVFWLAGGANSAYKGVYRNVLMNSVGKPQGLKVSGKGLIDRSTESVLTTDPDQAAEMLLGPGRTRDDLKNVESIYNALAKNSEKDIRLKDFRDYLAKAGLQEPELVAENESQFLARLRDRIVNQGMQPIFEDEDVGVGGRAKGIEHLEDLVFRRGTQGIKDALDIVKTAAERPAATTTVKWDGRPAVVFGRKPQTGEFVLTDDAGFQAKGYDGLATSPNMMARIQQQRSGDRTALIELYRRLFPILNAAVPENFRGYVKGDLLYINQPPEVAGNFEFTPNTVQYRIPVNSSLGQKIANSQIGIAVHTMYADQGEPRQPLSRVSFNQVPGLLLIDPKTSVPKNLELNKKIVGQLRQLIRDHGRSIDILFNPIELRSNRITDFARLCIDFVNTKVGQTLNYSQLLSEFIKWLETKVTPQKFKNIIEYLRSPTSNIQALSAAFAAFLLLHDLKEDLRSQLDLQHPGQEGWVMATPKGYAKLVGRFVPTSFAALNREKNIK